MKQIICIFLFLSTTITSAACECEGKQIKIDSSLKEATTVFKARVLSKKYVSIIKEAWGDLYNPDSSYINSPLKHAVYEYKLSVLRTYKGKAKACTTIYSEISSGECGYAFDLGKLYIVYATLEKANMGSATVETEIYKTSTCTATGKYSQKNEKRLRHYVVKTLDRK